MDFNDPKMMALATALAKAQAEFGVITKNRSARIRMKSGGQYTIRYADLDEINRATRSALSKHGLSVIQPLQTEVENTSTMTVIETILLHAEGGFIKSRLEIRGAKQFNDQKEFAAEVSYMRRYAVTALLGLAADDDADQNGRALGEGGETEEQRALQDLLAQEKAALFATKTDKAALDYWNANKAKFIADPQGAYKEFKDACVQHRTDLAAKAPQEAEA